MFVWLSLLLLVFDRFFIRFSSSFSNLTLDIFLSFSYSALARTFLFWEDVDTFSGRRRLSDHVHI